MRQGLILVCTIVRPLYALRPRGDNKLPIGQVSHTLQAEMLIVHQAQKQCTTLLEQIG
jgi:hypothetical protein